MLMLTMQQFDVHLISGPKTLLLNPVVVQSMITSDTRDTEACVAEVLQLAEAGCQIVRITAQTRKYAENLENIRDGVRAAGCEVPLVADIHFDHNIALRVADLGVDCLRINPGNITREDRLREVIAKARDLNIPIRIGVNAGSLGKDLLRKYSEPTAEAMVESAMRNVELLDKYDFQDFKVSVKASDIFMAVAAYRDLATRIEQPLHLGITEAGGLRSGTVKSAIGLGALLLDGIGDTVRISLAADPAEEDGGRDYASHPARAGDEAGGRPDAADAEREHADGGCCGRVRKHSGAGDHGGPGGSNRRRDSR